MIEPAAEVSRNRADRQADQPSAKHHADANNHRNARAIENARKNIAAQFVSPHPVTGAGTNQPRSKILRRRIGRRNPRRRPHQKDQQQRERETPPPRSVLAEKLAQAIHSKRTRGSTTACTRSVARLTTT